MKISYKLIDKLYQLNRVEWDLLLYIVKAEDQATGKVEGVFYRDVIKHTGMCKQSFYNALRGLQEKNVISCEQNSEVDYDVSIPDNAFPNKESLHNGYVNLNRKAFHSKAFQMLKPHEKYLLFYFLKSTHEGRGSKEIGFQRFYEKFTKLLKISKKVLRSYLHTLKQFFSIGLKGENYYITYLHSEFKHLSPGDAAWKSERSWYLEGLVKKECHRQHISYDEQSLEDVAYLPVQYQNFEEKKSLLEKIRSCIQQSIAGVKYSERILENRYIHKLLKKALGVSGNI